MIDILTNFSGTLHNEDEIIVCGMNVVEFIMKVSSNLHIHGTDYIKHMRKVEHV